MGRRPLVHAARGALKGGDELHVVGMPRLDLAEISRFVRDHRASPDVLTRTLPFEIVVRGVYAK